MDTKLIIFDWGGVVEPRTYETTWKKIQKICGIKNTDLKEAYFKDPQRSLIKSKTDFIKDLDKMLTDTPMKIPEDDNSYSIVTGAKHCPTEYGKGLYLYSIYQSVFRTVPYKKDVADMIARLPTDNIKTALLSDVGVWDLDRQNQQLKIDSFSFVWRSCQIGLSKRIGSIYRHVARQLGAAGFHPENVLFIDDNPENTEKAARECGWDTYIDRNCESADKLRQIIDNFVS